MNNNIKTNLTNKLTIKIIFKQKLDNLKKLFKRKKKHKSQVVNQYCNKQTLSDIAFSYIHDDSIMIYKNLILSINYFNAILLSAIQWVKVYISSEPDKTSTRVGEGLTRSIVYEF